MTQVSKTTFKTGTAVLYPDNIAGEITPADLRAQMNNIADSTAFKKTGNTSPPAPADDGVGTGSFGSFGVGDIWIDETGDKIYVSVDSTTSAAVWLDLTGNSDTATAWATGRTITLTGDVTGVSAAFDGSGNLSFATTIAADSVALGTDTTGNYIATITGTANEVEVTGSGSETAGVTIGLPDDVTITGALIVDTDTFVVDKTNNRVGVGTDSPATQFETNGVVRSTRVGVATQYVEIDGGGASIGSITNVSANKSLELSVLDSGATGTASMIFKNGTVASPAERMRLTGPGALLHGTTTAGSAGAGDIVVNGGIFLGGSAAANELNDYEAGTWTPTFSASSGTFTTVTVGTGNDAPKYVKVGDVVYFSCYFTITTIGTAAGTLTVHGLPFVNKLTYQPVQGDDASSGKPCFGRLVSTNIADLVLHDGTQFFGSGHIITVSGTYHI